MNETPHPSEPLAGYLLHDRQPTSHERMAGQPWDASYHGGPAPWDIGRPQPAIVRLAAEGGFSGAVLDAGCGTGENALHIARMGLRVVGIDVAETALAMAREKAANTGPAIDIEFLAADAFHLECLGHKFQTVLDCGLFHAFDPEERSRYVVSLASVTERDGTLYVLCFSDEGPYTGPHPVREEELRAAFNPGIGWNVADIKPDRIQTRFHDETALRPGWRPSNGSRRELSEYPFPTVIPSDPELRIAQRRGKRDPDNARMIDADARRFS